MKNRNVLSDSSDAKTVKGIKYGYLTGILYLAPADTLGKEYPNLCPTSEAAGCRRACLYTAGRGAFSNVQLARIAKTKRFHDDHAAFMRDIVWSVERIQRKAARLSLEPLIRLNGTSDIKWENIPATRAGIVYANVFEAFPEVQFYDYTKIPNRRDLPSNYDLTFSWSGTAKFQKVLTKAKKNPEIKRYAVVFSDKARIPTTFLGMPVTSGNNSDIRHLDPVGCVSLEAKGQAKKDTTGFVAQV
jgi:hypothetical protein